MLNREFVLAGKSIFTVHNQQTGNRYTFKVTKKDARKEGDPAVFFVNFLTGPDNESDYTYLGMLDLVAGTVRATRATSNSAKGMPLTAAQWTLGVILRNQQPPAHVTIQHAGRCCRCGRLLTVPESIESGWGPECRKLAD